MAAGDLISRATLKTRLEATATESDDVLDAVIAAASDAIRQHVGLDYVEATETRVFPIYPNAVDLGFVDTPGLRAVTGDVLILDADGTTISTLAAGDVVLEPIGSTGVFDRLRLKSTADAGFGGNAWLSVEGTFGFAAVPPRAAEACVVTCRAWLRQDSNRWANLVELEDGRVVAPTPEGGWMLPIAAKQLLQNDRRRGIV